ncbi:DUF1684 domain-containing protein [Mucilaginibacter pedocola]|uniref:DUF1684 domain-containing protein n=1 Tax=Mucilaginibacter pedocola TaxID=1792845 RepID=A0A1S9PBL6_9SPHI|nr:DUF1684 domain-containing protein [Mucilaginibacter pedocola]OOQ58350.1 hypothetical protein BC343_09950 [Mucilaginibacter pedocola]
MKYLLILLLFTSTTTFAQNHAAQIAAFRDKYKADFLEDSRSPLKKDDLPYLRFYDADSTYRVQAKAELVNASSAFIMPVFAGTGSEYVKYATLTMQLQGAPVTLTVYRNTRLAKVPGYTDYLFLPFTDDTNGKETYGGGRYIDLREADFKNGEVTIDFNKAYNPYCAFAGGYSCPKPPDENHLQLAIAAGEKKYGKEVGH